jgi:hypothetical protein
MGWLKGRFERKKEILYLFIVCILPIHFGGYLQFLMFYPSNILKFDLPQLFGIFGYFTTFVLLESGAAFIICALLGLITPEVIWKWKLPALLTSTILIFFIHGLAFYLVGTILTFYFLSAREIFIGLVLGSFLFLIISNFYKLIKSPEYESRLITLIEKLVPLIIIYLAIDIVGLIIVIFRNIN